MAVNLLYNICKQSQTVAFFELVSFEARYLLNVCRYGRFGLKVEHLNPGDVLLFLLALSTKHEPIQVSKAQTGCFIFSEQKDFF